MLFVGATGDACGLVFSGKVWERGKNIFINQKTSIPIGKAQSF